MFIPNRINFGLLVGKGSSAGVGISSSMDTYCCGGYWGVISLHYVGGLLSAGLSVWRYNNVIRFLLLAVCGVLAGSNGIFLPGSRRNSSASIRVFKGGVLLPYHRLVGDYASRDTALGSKFFFLNCLRLDFGVGGIVGGGGGSFSISNFLRDGGSQQYPLALGRVWDIYFRFPSLLSSAASNQLVNLPNVSKGGVVGNNLFSNFFISDKRRFTTFSGARNLYYRLLEDAIIGDVLIRALESLTLNRVWLSIHRAVQRNITNLEISYLQLLRLRLNRHLRSSRAKGLWYYVGTCLLLAFKSKDTSFIISWLHYKLSRISAFTHKRFLTFFIFLLKSVLVEMGDYFGVVGCRLDVVGKISVAGNARTRSIVFKQGKTSFANTRIKVATEFYLVRTHTGCLGLTIWLFYV